MTLLSSKEESEKVGLKLNIQKTNIMASGPITSWEIDGETVKTVSDFIVGGSKEVTLLFQFGFLLLFLFSLVDMSRTSKTLRLAR